MAAFAKGGGFGLRMKRHERAAQLWSLLALAAQNQKVLSYKTISRLTGMNRAGVGSMLGPITHYCLNHKLPQLTSIVVNEKTGLPGQPLIGKKPEEIFREQSRVFIYD